MEDKDGEGEIENIKISDVLIRPRGKDSTINEEKGMEDSKMREGEERNGRERRRRRNRKYQDKRTYVLLRAR